MSLGKILSKQRVIISFLTMLEPSGLVFADSVDQDQTAQNMQLDFRSTQSATLLQIMVAATLI